MLRRRCDGMQVPGRGGDFGRKTNGTRGLANTKRVHRGPGERNGEIAGSPRRRVQRSPTCSRSLPQLRCKTHLPERYHHHHHCDRTLYSHAELILSYQVSRNETTTSLIPSCRNARDLAGRLISATRMTRYQRHQVHRGAT